MLSVTLGLLGAVIFGAADFLGGLAAKRLRSVLVTAVAATVGLLLLLLCYPWIGGSASTADIAWGALSGVFGVAAIILLYACLAIGPMSILSPLTAVVSAIAPMLWGLLVKGEQLSWAGDLGLAVALVAVVLVGFIPGQRAVRPSLRGIVMAVGSGAAIGGFMITIDQTSDESGLVPLMVNRGVNATITFGAVAVIAALAAARRRRPESAPAMRGFAEVAALPLGATPTGHADLEHAATTGPAIDTVTDAGGSARLVGLWLAISCGVVDTVANVLLLLALRAGDLAVVSVLTAMYPTGTIVLAAIVLRERIALVQWIGLVLALTAGALFALA